MNRTKMNILSCFLIAVLATVVLKTGIARATSSSNCGAWSIVPSPIFNGTGYNFFSGVAPVSANNIWAVGSYSNFSQTLIEHWNGRQWSIVSSPSPGLYYNDIRGVTAISARNIWAVGAYRVSSDSPTQTLIEHWKNGKWSIVPSPNPGTGGNILLGVAALSSNNITAVGNYLNNTNPNLLLTLIEHWNGTQWSIVSSPNIPSISDSLSGVSVLSKNNKWAVGTTYMNNTQQTLIEHWDGTSWSIVSSPNLSDVNALFQIAAISTSDIWTVGTASLNTLVEHWDGTSWSIISSPSPGSGVKYLNGVTAISSNDVWAGGAAQTGSNGEVQTLIEHWDGTSWSVIPSPNPEPSNNGILNSVERVPGTSSQIWTVGSYTDSNGVGQTLTEFYC